MPFQVECPRCGNKLNVKDEWEGKRLKCPKCAAVFPAVRPVEVAAAVAAPAAAAPVMRSRVEELAVDEQIKESKYALPFTFGPDDRYPRLLYWGFMIYLLLDSIFAIPVFVGLIRDRVQSFYIERLVGWGVAIILPWAIGVCIFVAFSMGGLIFAAYKLLLVGIVITAALGLSMDNQHVDVGSTVLQGIWHAVGLFIGLWYFIARRE